MYASDATAMTDGALITVEPQGAGDAWRNARDRYSRRHAQRDDPRCSLRRRPHPHPAMKPRPPRAPISAGDPCPANGRARGAAHVPAASARARMPRDCGRLPTDLKQPIVSLPMVEELQAELAPSASTRRRAKRR